MTNRSLFYYFVEAENDSTSKNPVVLWLNGGLDFYACSSVGHGVFVENGPFKPTKKGIIKNDYSWNKEANMLYLDSLAGIGFSYLVNNSFYNTVTDEITAKDNLVFLKNWFAKFLAYMKNDFFITGESYAGHYAPQLVQLILQTNTKFNLKGIAIGNQLLEFNTDFNSRADILLSHGVISHSTYEMMKTECNYSTIQRQSRSEMDTTDICDEVNVLLLKEVGGQIDPLDISFDVCQSSDKTRWV